MAVISSRVPSVVVEYDCRGQRAEKKFNDAYEARWFYVKQDREGKNPKLRKC